MRALGVGQHGARRVVCKIWKRIYAAADSRRNWLVQKARATRLIHSQPVLSFVDPGVRVPQPAVDRVDHWRAVNRGSSPRTGRTDFPAATFASRASTGHAPRPD